MRTHPVALLVGAIGAFLLVDLLAIAALWAALQVAGCPTPSLPLLAAAAGFGVALGVTYGAVEGAARARGLLAAGLVGLGLAPLPSLAGAWAALRAQAACDLEAIESLRRCLVEAEPWRAAPALLPVGLLLHGPLLRARLRERDVAAQVLAMCAGGAAWVGLLVLLPDRWPLATTLAAWWFLLPLVVRAGATAPLLAACVALADRALRRVRGVDAPPGQVAAARPRARRAALVVVGGAAIGTTLCLTRCREEPARVTALRALAWLGDDREYALCRGLAYHPMPSSAFFKGFLGPVGLGGRAPAGGWQERLHAEAVERLRGLIQRGHVRSIEMAVRRLDRASRRSEFDPEALIAAGAALRGEDPLTLRVRGELLLHRGLRRRLRAAWDEGDRLLTRAADAGDARAMIRIVQARWLRDPRTAAALLRKALDVGTEDERRLAAVWLEELCSSRLDLRPAGRRVDPLRVVDQAGAPVDGAVRLFFDGPLDEWGEIPLSAPARAVRAGLVEGGLDARAGGCLFAVYAFDEQRLGARVCDGWARPHGQALRVDLESIERYREVRGRLLTAAGRPVPGRTVRLRAGSLEHAAEGLETFTDAEGEFLLRDLPLHDYQVGVVRADGTVVEETVQRIALGAPVELRLPAPRE